MPARPERNRHAGAVVGELMQRPGRGAAADSQSIHLDGGAEASLHRGDGEAEITLGLVGGSQRLDDRHREHADLERPREQRPEGECVLAFRETARLDAHDDLVHATHATAHRPASASGRCHNRPG
jgi:hypothetical protein